MIQSFQPKILLKKKREPIDIKFRDNNYLIGVGRLTKQKNFEILIKAFNQIIRKDNKTKLLILGDGEQMQKLNELIKQHAHNQDDVKTIKQMAIIQNIMCVIPIVLLLCLFIGCYKYYLRQWEDHKHHWSWYIFWMGTSKCRDLN